MDKPARRGAVAVLLGAALLTGAGAWVAGCDLTIALPPEMTFEVRKPTGDILSSKVIGPSDEEYIHLERLLKQERENWLPSIVSPVPSRYAFISKDLAVRCHETFLIIDFRQDGKPKSLKKTIDGVFEKLDLPKWE